MRAQQSDVPLFLRKNITEIDNKTYKAEYKNNQVFNKEDCVVCEECFLNVTDVNNYTSSDFHAIINQGLIKKKIVNIYIMS